ncbi:MAG: hypothetical protein A2Z29_05740 [Chloroflexi bacterium RBG_16_56_11]|nr:MAG: hypothetical protein A2Z29_05740 [Chloroflexi bacterium RBG_16_56_11]
MTVKEIRVISICVFRHDDSILVFHGFDSVKGTPFYRPLGGAVEFGETTREAIEREIREELGLEADDLKLLGTLENIFLYEGEPGHEIVFVYDGRFKDDSVYRMESLTVCEDNGVTMKATWRNLDSFDDYHRLVPEELMSLLRDNG